MTHTSPDANAAAIGHAVRSALLEAGYSLVVAAPLLGLSLKTLSRRVNGTLPFTWPELIKVAGLTGVTPGELCAHAERIAGRSAAS